MLKFILPTTFIIMIQFFAPQAQASYVTSTILTGLGGSFIGGTIAALAGNKKSTNYGPNIFLWSSVGAGVGLLGGLLFTSEVKNIEQLKIQNEAFQKELLEIRKSKSVENEVKHGVYDNLPVKIKDLIKPTEWKIYKVNEWTEMDEYHLRGPHEVLEIVPSAISSK